MKDDRRKTTYAERRKRGCAYCADGFKDGRRCRYEECPYKVLDKYNTYGEFLKSKDARFSNLEMWNRVVRNV